MAQWMISVRRGNVHKKVMVNKNEAETDKEVYYRARELYTQAKEKYHNCTVELISRKKAFAPTKAIKRGYTYCPFCRVDRLFQYINKTGNKHCPICGISDRDYHVRKFNHLWGKR